MAVKRFGPTRGAGVAVVELEGEKTIEPGALGMVAYAGILEKGPVGELIQTFNKTTFRKKCGSLIDDSLLPDAAEQYYDNAAGAGGVHLVRVTDGNELQAEATLYARRASVLTPMGTIKAHNGGRWGGKRDNYTADFPTDAATDLADTTLDTGSSAFTTDQWKGGWVEIEDVPNVRYPIVGNTNTGIITVAADQTMLTDYNALSGTSNRFYLVLEQEGKALSFQIGDGEDDPNGEFSLEIFVDGESVKKYPNLNTDPTSGKYWVDVINEDGSNDEIEVTDLWTGTHVASVRPANHYGLVDTIPGPTSMNAVIHDVQEAVVNPAVVINLTLGTTDDTMLAQKITITFTSATNFDAVSDKFGALGSGTTGALFTPNNKYSPPFTIDADASYAAADALFLNYKPFLPDSLIGGRLFIDKPNAPLVSFRITDNDHDSITVADGSDLTVDGAPADEFLVSYPTELQYGRDGNADLVDADYISQAYDVDLSPFNRMFGKNYGLVKLATPGVTSTAVQKAGVAYASAKNYQYRYEAPSNVLTDTGAIDLVNETLGRSDYAVMSFPSYGSVPDATSTEGKLKLVSLTGQIHGREARIAVDFDGYHKAEAGLEAVLPATLKIPTGETQLNEEILNPAGISVIKKLKGNFVIWGDRTLYLDPTWKWKHQREQMSYYENVLRESFDWIVFAINDPLTEKIALAALRSFFEPEFVKRALRGKDFDDAAKIKIDGENNTDATRAAGDLFADVKLRLADTVERFVIRIGKQGIFDAAG